MTRWGKKSILGFVKVVLLGIAMSCLQMLLVCCKCGKEATKRHPGDPLRGREALEKTSPAKGTLQGLRDRWIELFRLKLRQTFHVRHYAFHFMRTKMFWAASL